MALRNLGKGPGYKIKPLREVRRFENQQRQKHLQAVMNWQSANQQRKQNGEPTLDLALDTTQDSIVQRALMYAVRDYVEAVKIHRESDHKANSPAIIPTGKIQRPTREITTARTA